METPERLERIDRFVAETRAAVFVRRVDGLLMIRPDKTMQVNRTAMEILGALYDRQRSGAARMLERLSRELRVGRERLLDDTEALVDSVGAILREDFSPRPTLRFGTFDRTSLRYPTLAEFALTYGCQNRCAFCYASSPDRGDQPGVMTTAQVKRVMEVIYRDAHVPSLSFTGGEATLRRDLPELIAHGKQLGFRMNLITNGIRLADEGHARSLVEAGLDSAQVSLEAGEAALHDRLVGRAGAFEATTSGVQNMQRLGIHVHTNTTLCSENLARGEELVRFVGRDLKLRTMSMNMVIRTGEALDGGGIGVGYAEVGERLPALRDAAREEGVRLVWYSPTPYCIFNPVLAEFGAKSCACVDGILSVDPTGQVLPCSSFEDGLGSLLERSYQEIYESRAARYWKRKEFLPPVCRGCPEEDICGGGCPLYWDAAGSFAELPRPGAGDPALWEEWRRCRQEGESFGVRPRGEGRE